MNKLRPHPAERLLEQTRSAVPGAGVRARVLAGLEQRIGGDASVEPEPASLLAPPFARAPLGVARSSSNALAALRWASFGVAMGALGYWWGRHDAEPASSATAPVIVVAAPSVTPAASVGVALPSEPAPVDVVAVPPAPEPARVAAAAPRAAARRPTKARAPSNDESLTLAQALELLRRAEAELRRGDASGARVLLGELDRGAPAKLLREERLAARGLAACLDGDASAADRYARELAAENPSSMYRGRLEASCTGLGR